MSLSAFKVLTRVSTFAKVSPDTLKYAVDIEDPYEISGSEDDNDESNATEKKRQDDSAINALATHLPDQVVFADHTRSFPYQVTLQGVLMFLDISGFTSLTEKYSMNKKNGTDQLTKTLNGYMRDLVNEIIVSDGDILKFAGDAILTLWEVDSFLKMKVTVAHVIKCAMDIQEKCGTFATSVGVILKVKIGISAGEMMVTYLGNEEYCHNVTMGRAVESVNVAEKFCISGDVVVSPSAWVHCAGLPLEVEIQDDAKHRKVLGFEVPPQQVAREYTMQRTLAIDTRLATTLKLCPEKSRSRKTSLRKNSSLMKSMVSPGASSSPNKQEILAGKAGSGNDELRVRKAVVENISEAMKSRMRLYIAIPVLKKLDAGQPLEYLSEMRQVTIVFINLVTIEGTKYENCQTLQAAFKIIYANIKHAQGCLNKVFMFDKGCTFLAIFGLPGFKHENDCARALQCSEKIKNEMRAVAKVTRTSVGVTTGSSYCGVVGHDHRHEYTVIGRKVNMAARLMMAYGGKVTCDNETYHHSKLHKANFIQLEFKQMKGLQNIGTIREYKENKSRKGTIDALLQQEYEMPLIGRLLQIESFHEELRHIKQGSTEEKQRQLIVLKGEAGVGKSRLLDSLIVNAVKQDIRVVFCHLHMADAKTPYHAVTSMLMELLEFEYDTPHQEREQALYQTFQDTFIIENLPMLNDLLHLKLAQGEKYIHMDAKKRSRIFHDLLFKIVHEMTLKFGYIIFAIDDAHFMDPESWEFVEELGHDMMSLVLVTLKTSSKYYRHPAAENVLKHTTTLTIPVAGLESENLCALACQLLGCICIPKQVESILQQKSHGVPSWCEQLLHSMLYDGLLSVVPVSAETHGQQMISPPDKFKIRKLKAPLVTAQASVVHQRRSSLGSDTMKGGLGKEDHDMMCILAESVTLSDVRIPDSIKGMIQARIDRMEELEQMIIKTSAILGMSFSRRMLDTILPKKITPKMVQDCMNLIAESSIFCCASLDNSQASGVAATTVTSASRGGRYVCGCPGIGGDEDRERTINDCQMLIFKSATLQETAYEMYTESLRRKLHMKAARYLESQAHKCSSCGGGNFIPSNKAGQASEVPPSALAQKLPDFVKASESPKSSSRGKSAVSKMRKQSIGSTMMAQVTLGNVEGKEGQERVKRQSLPSASISDMPVSDSDAVERPRSMSLTSKRHSIPRNVVAPSEASADQSLISMQSSGGRLASIQSSLNRMESTTTPVIDQVLRDKVTEGTEDEEGDELLQNLDIRECRCMQILLSVYPQLVRHWKAAGMIEKTVHFLMEASAAAIAIDENLQALSYLKEIKHIFKCLKEGSNPFEGEVSHVETYVYDSWEEARMESLIGQALYHMGHLDEAIPHFHTTLKILGSTQPTSKFAVCMGIMREGFLQWQHHKFPQRFLGKASTLLAPRLIEQSRCLSHVFHDYQSSRRPHRALLTVLQQVNKAEEVNSDLHELVIAYTCMMEYCQERHWPKLGGIYEYKAQVRCMMKKKMRAEDLMSMAHLECTSMNMRLAWGRIADAIESGYTANRIIQTLHDNDMLIQMLPILANSLIMAHRIKDAVEVLEELEYIDNETDALVGKAWYYACCLELILESGVQIESYEKCSQFAHRHMRDHTFGADKMPMFYLTCTLALWCQRKGRYDEVEKWTRAAKEVEPVSHYRSCMNLWSQLKLLEVELLELARCKRRNKQDRILLLTPIILKEIKRLERLCKFVPLCQPRLLHYQAYYSAQWKLMRKAQATLKKSLALCSKTGHEQERRWISHNQKAWLSPRTEKKQDDLWLSQSYSKDNIDWHAACDNPVKFSLPLPNWFE